jgi:hypothetical protein
VTGTSRPAFDLPAFQRACTSLADALRSTKIRTLADFALVPDPAVGGNVNHPLVDPAPADVDDRVDVNRWISAIRKANDAADEYAALAFELGDLIARYRLLRSRQVPSPENLEPTSPTLLDSSIVKLDMTEHLTRLERFQVAAMGYAGAWEMLSDEWQLALENAQDEGE